MDNEQQTVEQALPVSGCDAGEIDGRPAGHSPGRGWCSRVLPPLLAVSLSTVLLYGATAWFRAPAGPQLRLPQLPLDLGRGEPHTSPRGTFEISNSGSKDLTFKITPSCGCAALEPREGTLAPGEFRNVSIAVRLEHRNGRRNMRLTLNTNDPARPEAFYDVSALCPPLLEVSPGAVDFGDVAEGTERRATVRVRLPKGSSLKSLAGVRYAVRQAWCEVTPLRHTDYILDLSLMLRADAPRTLLASQPELAAPGHETVTVPVRADVVGEVIVAPAIVRPAWDEVAQGFRPVICVVRATGDGGLGELKSIDAPDGVNVEALSQAQRQAVFRLQVTRAALDADAALKLRFDRQAQAVVVPIAPEVTRASDP